MRFRRMRAVHVTTREDLDSALNSADQVIVEGDDRLLSYAASRAARDPEPSEIEIEIAGRPAPTEDKPFNAFEEDEPVSPFGNTIGARPAFSPAAFPAPSAPAALPPKRLNRRLFLWLTVVFVLALVVLGAVWVFLSFAEDATKLWFALSAEPMGAALPQHPTPPAPPAGDSIPQLVASLAWPVVSVVAILALFFIARQAIVGGRNLEISWKVTEKVTGRVVITKVRSRANNARSAA